MAGLLFAAAGPSQVVPAWLFFLVWVVVVGHLFAKWHARFVAAARYVPTHEGLVHRAKQRRYVALALWSFGCAGSSLFALFLLRLDRYDRAFAASCFVFIAGIAMGVFFLFQIFQDMNEQMRDGLEIGASLLDANDVSSKFRKARKSGLRIQAVSWMVIAVCVVVAWAVHVDAVKLGAILLGMVAFGVAAFNLSRIRCPACDTAVTSRGRLFAGRCTTCNVRLWEG